MLSIRFIIYAISDAHMIPLRLFNNRDWEYVYLTYNYWLLVKRKYSIYETCACVNE